MRNLDNLSRFREIARLLKPRGRVAILRFFKPTGFLAKMAYTFYVSTIVPIRGGEVSKNKEAYDYLQTPKMFVFPGRVQVLDGKSSSGM